MKFQFMSLLGDLAEVCRRESPEQWICTGSDGNALTEEFYRSQAVGRAAKAAGQAKVNPYVLLHTFA